MKKQSILNLFAFFIFITIFVTPTFADEPEGDQPEKEQEKAESFITDHQIEIDGEVIKYQATVGWLILKNDDDEPTARFAYTAYIKSDVEKKAKRPIMFAFNGGPGSSSLWLHMGILGPQRVIVTDEGYSPPPPVERIDNIFSVLDDTDLVMVDPVGTGFSKPLGDAKGNDFWGVDSDIESVGTFIKQYVTVNGRWASPKYILGESYGGVRSAGLAWHLHNRHNMNINGLIMVSPFLNPLDGRDGSYIDLPHVLFLPSLAATAWYHDAIPNKPDNIAAFMEEVDRFAFEEYAPALLKGFTISPEEKQTIAERLAGYTGTSVDYWLKADLRVSHLQFVQELKRDERIITGRIDSRFLGPAVDPLSESMDYDPFFPSVGPAFTAAFMDYLHSDLAFDCDEEYHVSASLSGWDWSHRTPDGKNLSWSNMLPDLSRAITANPGMYVLVQQGYFDLATPTLATKHYLSHLDIPADARERITTEYYEAGHMMYLHKASMKKFKEDVANLIHQSNRLN